MQTLSTKLTKCMNISSPIVVAPMAFASTAGLISAVTSAGAFGFFGAGFDTSEQLVTALRTIRHDLKVPPGASLPAGVGFISWILKLTEGSDDPRLVRVLEELPKAIWFAFGDDLGDYIAQVRAYDEKRDFKTLIYVIVNSVEEALRATNEWKVDALAGGHGGAKAPPLFQLLPAVLAAVPEDGPLVLAAGGVATGAQIASLLTLGASGVVLGTRFLFTHESAYSSARKDVLIKAGLNATARGLMFDEVGRTMGWPDGIDGRAIANGIWRDHDERLDLDERLRRFDESSARGESERLVIWTGVGVGLTDKIQSAEVCIRNSSTDFPDVLVTPGYSAGTAAVIYAASVI
ncbi:2-nitropropane dioxygenase [Desarmillaria ectypa]|nr:2-nitropropane dioxygenase [Desarmillaria ectypa]